MTRPRGTSIAAEGNAMGSCRGYFALMTTLTASSLVAPSSASFLYPLPFSTRTARHDDNEVPVPSGSASSASPPAAGTTTRCAILTPSTGYIDTRTRFPSRVGHSSHLTCPSSSRPRSGGIFPRVSASRDDGGETIAEREVDVVVIGSGIGGLSCAALSARYGLDVVCLEAHDTAGGCAHSFERYSSASSGGGGGRGRGDERVPFVFDSGPSLVSGVSAMGTNPLRQVLDAVGTADEIEWKTYDGWMVHDFSDGKKFRLTTGDGGAWEKSIEEKAGEASRKAFERFRDRMLEPRGLTESSAYIPPFALRSDAWAIVSLGRYLLKLLSIGTKGALLTGPFTDCMDLYDLRDDFNRKWFDYLAFALSGLDAAHTQAAPVAYTMSDLHRPGAVLDYPVGGMGAIVDALVSGLRRHGGSIELNSRVDRLLLAETTGGRGSARCHGVVLAEGGGVIRARRGVVCNAPLWYMARMLEDSLGNVTGGEEPSDESALGRAVGEVKRQADRMEMTGSFMHLHLGIPSDGLGDVECHHSVLDMDKGITDPQNLVIISIPTVFDPGLAPKGYHIVHAYTAASEDFNEWVDFMDGGSESGKVGSSPSSGRARAYSRREGYERLKAERAEALWRAVEQVIPDVRERARREGSITLVGTPLTHRRYNQRFRGTYGPAPPKGKQIWELNSARTPVDGLLACGDTCFPGIGLPGVAASGTIAANTLVDVRTQLTLMEDLRKIGSLQ